MLYIQTRWRSPSTASRRHLSTPSTKKAKGTNLSSIIKYKTRPTSTTHLYGQVVMRSVSFPFLKKLVFNHHVQDTSYIGYTFVWKSSSEVGLFFSPKDFCV